MHISYGPNHWWVIEISADKLIRIAKFEQLQQKLDFLLTYKWINVRMDDS